MAWAAALLVSMGGVAPAQGIGGPAGEATARRRTIADVNEAIEGETNAAHKYRLFAQQADREGYTEVAKLFHAAAESESIHRRNHEEALAQIHGPAVPVTLEPVQVGTTRENLEVPLRGEKYEQSEMYPSYIRRAQAVGATAAARSFTYARDAEKQHEQLFARALQNLGRNPPQVYFVSTVSGETIAASPGSAAPAPRLPGERYIEIR